MIKNGEESIQNHIIINNKPISGTFTTEYALHNKHKFRTLRDKSTDSVVNSLFSYDYNNNNPIINNNNSIRRNLFLMYVYDYFNLNIISDFDIYLMNNNCEILNEELEYVLFLFKGGNVYFHIITELIDKFNVFNGLTEVQVNNLKEDFTKNFGVSDFDFTVNLYCTTHEKFIKIKNHLVKFLIKKLEEITLFFNSYFIDTFNKRSDYTRFINNSLTIINNTLELNNDPIQNPNRLNTHSERRNYTEERIMLRLIRINNYFSELHNNKFFIPFIDALNKNTNSNFNLKRQISDNMLEHYSKIISPFESYKVKRELFQIIIKIFIINDLLQLMFINPVNNEEFILHPSSNKEFNAYVIKVFSKLILINNIYTPNDIFIINQNFKINDFIEKQHKFFIKTQKMFKGINFYSEDIFVKIFNNIAEAINNIIFNNTGEVNIFVKDPKEEFLFKGENSYYDQSNYEIVKLYNRDYRFTFQDISIESVDNNLFQKDNFTKNFYINKKNNNFHYITHNASIYSALNEYSSIVNFDLLRSKLNFKLNNVLVKKFLPDIPNNWINGSIKIPSEFIDVSISNYEDSFYNTFIKNPNGYKSTYEFSINLPNFENKHFNIISMSVSYFIHDLISILFSQNLFYPWVDVKYNKRIFRLLFLYMINDKQHTIPYIATLYRIADNMVNYIETNNPLNLLFINQLGNYNILNNSFKNFAENIIKNHMNLKAFRFADDNLYFHHLDELVNCLFFSFYIYYLHLKGNERNEYPDLARRLINLQRNMYKYFDLTRNEYITLYHNNTLEFIKTIKRETEKVLNHAIAIANRLPNFYQ